MGITTHVLDTAAGRPGAGVPVALERRNPEEGWILVATARTDEDGRVADLLGAGDLTAGLYRLRFDTEAYYRARGEMAFFPQVHVAFHVRDARAHHHVPLLLSPFGYTTYRGS